METVGTVEGPPLSNEGVFVPSSSDGGSQNSQLAIGDSVDRHVEKGKQ